MTEVWGWEAFFREVLSFLGQVHLENASQGRLEYYLERLEVILSNTHRIKNVLDSSPQPNNADEMSVLDHYRRSISEVLMHLNRVYTEIDRSLDAYLSSSATAYQSGTVHSSRRGRPKFDITEDQLTYLASLSFKWKQVARMLGVSRMTLYRRRVEFGMVPQGRNIQDRELVRVIREMRSEFPEMGEVMVLGRLRSLGYHVIRDVVRRVIHETDPINTALQATTGLLVRRVYSVPGPNSLWHVGKFRLSLASAIMMVAISFFSLQMDTTSLCGGGLCRMDALMAIAV